MYDVIIIGAGPAGLMAAIKIDENKKVLILDKNDQIGKKIEITGNGRCNILNLKQARDFINALPNKDKFLYSALSNYNPIYFYEYFEANGLALKVEAKGRVFPQSDSAMSLIKFFDEKVTKDNIRTHLNNSILQVSKIEDKFEVVTEGETYTSEKVIITTGGMSYPLTGSTGDGYTFAETLGHNIVEPYPCEAPLYSNDKIIANKDVQGITLSDVLISLPGSKIKFTNSGIITHFGLSGPLAFQISQYVYKDLVDKKMTTLVIDLVPSTSIENFQNEFINSDMDYVKKYLYNYVPKKLVDEIFKLRVKLAESKNILSGKKINEIILHFKKFKLNVDHVGSLKQAIVTGGGINTKEINPKTMESKLVSNLYFAGEIIDVHGFTGGYNISIALATGATAGDNI